MCDVTNPQRLVASPSVANEEGIDVNADDLTFVCLQLVASPADGPVHLQVDQDGRLTAEWPSRGKRSRTGPPQVRQIREILGD